jgi:flagellar biogenesis protein FliO
MSVESSLSLGERRSLVVIGVVGRRLMIGLAPGQVHLVTELQPAPGRGERVA